MVKRIEWSEFAKDQLRNIYNYYSEAAGKRIAKKLINKIVKRVDILIANPLAGGREDLLSGYSEEYRYLVVENYKIIYWIKEQVAIISTVFDCRQNPVKMTEHI